MRWLVLILAVTGCAGPLAAHREHIAQTAGPRGPLSLHLIHGELRLLGSGTIGGENVRWDIDTGASDHWVAEERGGRTRTTISMLDVRQDADLDVETVVHGAGTAGVLSPERLVSAGGALELDLPRRMLHRLTASEVNRARDELVGSGAAIQAACEGGMCVPMVHVAIDGRDAALVVDTGAPTTVLFSEADAAVHVARRGIHVRAYPRFIDDHDAYGVGVVTVVHGVTIHVARRAMQSKNLVVIPHPNGLEQADGLLGLDVLQGCTILVDGRARGALACDGAAGEIDGLPDLAKAQLVPPILVRGTVADVDGGAHVTVEKVEVRGTSHRDEIEAALSRNDVSTGPDLDEKLATGESFLLSSLYDHGFVDAKVQHSVERHGDRVTVRFDVTEGRVYRYSSIAVTGDLVAPEAEYLKLVTQRRGDVFDRSSILRTILAIRALHKRCGHADIGIEPESTVDAASATIGVTLRATHPAPS